MCNSTEIRNETPYKGNIFNLRMFSCNLGSYAASNHPKQPHQCFHFLPCKYSTVLCIAKLSSSFSWHWTRGEKEKQTNIQIKNPNKTERRNKEQKNVNMRAKKEMVVCLKSSKIPLFFQIISCWENNFWWINISSFYAK